jgi:hypothetical protein
LGTNLSKWLFENVFGTFSLIAPASSGDYLLTVTEHHMATDPNRLFTRIFFNLTGAQRDADSLRRIAAAGTQAAEAQLLAQHRQWAAELLDDPKNNGFFSDKAKFIEVHGGGAELAEHMAAQELSAFRGSIDAASIVSMHSALDGALQDLCRVAALVDPVPWRSDVQAQQISLREVRERGYYAIQDERVTALVERLSRESLVKKTDRLFELCQPRDYLREGYEFDRARLLEVDNLRHDIIHGSRPRTPIEQVNEHLTFLAETGMYFFGMVNYRYRVRIDPAYAV